MFSMHNGQYELYEEYRGVVESSSQRSDTHVSAPGSVIGGSAPVTSEVTVNNDFWVKQANGKQEKFSYVGESYFMPGHEVSLIALRCVNPKIDGGVRHAVRNLTTDQSVYLWKDELDKRYNMIEKPSGAKQLFYIVFFIFMIILVETNYFRSGTMQYVCLILGLAIPIIQGVRGYFKLSKRMNDFMAKLDKEEDLLFPTLKLKAATSFDTKFR